MRRFCRYSAPSLLARCWLVSLTALVWTTSPGCNPPPPPPPAPERVEISGAGSSTKPTETPDENRSVTETLDLSSEDSVKTAATGKNASRRERGSMSRSRPLTMQPTAAPVTVQIVALRTAAEGATVEPGEVEALVVIDGQFARDKQGNLLRTPCELELSPGEHVVRLAAKGYHELAQSHIAEDGRVIEMTMTYEPFAAPEGIIASRFVTAAVGDELAFETFRKTAAMGDPFVTPDQMTLYLSGDGPDGKGIYVARRQQPWEEFGPAEFIASTRSAEPAASPSVNGDQSQLAWLIAGKARIWGVGLTGERQPKHPLKFTTLPTETWTSVWMSPSGLSLYSRQTRSGVTHSCQVQRLADDEVFEDDWSDVAMHDAHPMLSSDALRLYTFDGKTLSRALRERDTEAFGPLEPLVEIPLANYHVRPDRRQFWVTDDEQWMFYSDDPEREGTIYVTRIADAPVWVDIPVGQRITGSAAPRPDQPEPTTTAGTMPDKDAAAFPDPRTLPLPYETYRAELLTLLAEWKFDEALAAVESASTSRDLVLDRELVGWDRDEVTAAKRFYDELLARLGMLTPGTEIRLAGAPATFQVFADGVLSVEIRKRETKKPLATISASDLIALVDKQHDPDDVDWAWSVAAFLVANPQRVSQAILNSRLDKAGVHGRQYIDRQRRRDLALIRHEISRKNIGPALVRIEALVAKAPKSETATQALEIKETLSARQVWRAVGTQAWETSVAGQFSTGDKTSPDAYLTCDDRFTNFQASLEWKAVGPAAQGGLYFGYAGTGPLRENAFKVHVANDGDMAARPDKFSTGALLGQIAPQKNVVRAEGEWNSLVVRVVSRRITVTINGEVVLKDQPIEAPAGDAAAAKTAAREKSGAVESGPVLIDGEYPGITYRKILVYELPSAKPVPRKESRK